MTHVNAAQRTHRASGTSSPRPRIRRASKGLPVRPSGVFSAVHDSARLDSSEPVNKCPSCGRAIEAQVGPGRPRIYCSIACRRVGELRIRRLNGQLEGLEQRERWLRDPSRRMTFPFDEAEAKFIVAEMAAIKDELRRLFGGGSCE